MFDKSLPVETILAVLTETPRRLAELAEGRTASDLRSASGPDTWSPNDLLAHLRACADQWDGAIRTILDKDNPTIRAVNPTTWIHQTEYPNLDFRVSLAAFSARRAELLALPDPLAEDDWYRAATVTGAGAPRTRTLHAYASKLADHEREHVCQIHEFEVAVRKASASG